MVDETNETASAQAHFNSELLCYWLTTSKHTSDGTSSVSDQNRRSSVGTRGITLTLSLFAVLQNMMTKQGCSSEASHTGRVVLYTKPVHVS